MKKVLIVIFNDGEETVFHDILMALEGKRRTKLVNDIFIGTPLFYDSIEIDPRYRTVKCHDTNIKLTDYEFNIIYLLATHPQQVFSKKQIYEQVWKMPYFGAEDNVVSLIHRIRKKIEPVPSKPIYILTVWGIGYKFNNQASGK